MFNNLAFDVVIGLIFIYLLYSLLATVIAEIIATNLGLRARNLKEAVNRMLNDEQEYNYNGRWRKVVTNWLSKKIYRLLDSCKLLKNPKNPIIANFYNHPEIKYLGSSGLFKNPSSFKAVSFSKTLLYQLNGSGIIDVNKVDAALRNKAQLVLGEETASYVLSMWEDSERNVVKFKQQLEAWFDRTMEQATEWYKRKIQFVLLLIGFTLAWTFNADTIVIVKKLSQDKDAREQLVNLTSAYFAAQPTPPKSISESLDANQASRYSEKMDSLLSVKKKLETDITSANSILGFGSWLPDSAFVSTDILTGKQAFSPEIDAALIRHKPEIKLTSSGYICFSSADKRNYFLDILGKHFWGFLLTAIAISLGAPFWFDLLNNIMKLRTSTKQPVASTNTNANNTVTPSNSSQKT